MTRLHLSNGRIQAESSRLQDVLLNGKCNSSLIVGSCPKICGLPCELYGISHMDPDSRCLHQYSLTHLDESVIERQKSLTAELCTIDKPTACNGPRIASHESGSYVPFSCVHKHCTLASHSQLISIFILYEAI